MISSEALNQSRETDITMTDETQHPISYQLSGHKPQMIADCAKYLEKYADMIDINMGCPVNKVVKGTDGCALMRNPDLAQEIMFRADLTHKFVWFKIKTSFSGSHKGHV